MDSLIITVDRAEPYQFPGLAHKLIHPAHGPIGPASYDLAKVRFWPDTPPSQHTKGYRLHDAVLAARVITYCLSMKDARAIWRHPNKRWLREFFGDRHLTLWHSAIEAIDKRRYVPVLSFGRTRAEVRWVDIGLEFSPRHYTPLYPEDAT